MFAYQSLKLLCSDHSRNGMTDFFETGEIPEIRKITALLRLDRLHRAVVALEKNTFAVRLVLQCQSLSIMAQVQERLDKIELAHSLEFRQTTDLCVGQAHLSRPPTAGGASLTFVKNRHPATITIPDRSASRRCIAFPVFFHFRVEQIPESKCHYAVPNSKQFNRCGRMPVCV